MSNDRQSYEVDADYFDNLLLQIAQAMELCVRTHKMLERRAATFRQHSPAIIKIAEQQLLTTIELLHRSLLPWSPDEPPPGVPKIPPARLKLPSREHNPETERG